jgi:hypothetical protein
VKGSVPGQIQGHIAAICIKGLNKTTKKPVKAAGPRFEHGNSKHKAQVSLLTLPFGREHFG